MPSLSGSTARRFILFSIRNPGLVLGVWLILAGIAVAQSRSLRLDTDVASFLDKSSEGWSHYQRRVELFGSDEFITIALVGDYAYAGETLRGVRHISGVLADLEGVESVDSIATVTEIGRDRSGAITVESGLDAVERTGERPRDAGGWMLQSQDARVFAINAFLHGTNDALREEAILVSEGLAQEFGGYVTGVPVFRSAVVARTSQEIRSLTPISVLVVAVVLWAYFRSLRPVVVALAVGSTGMLATGATMSSLEVPLSLSTFTLAPILLALGATYSVHISRILVRRDLSLGELGEVAARVWVSGATTSIGFAAMSVAPADAIRALGGFGALGVLVAVAAALTLGPALLGVEGHQISVVRLRWLSCRSAVSLAVRHSRVVILIWALVMIVGGAGLLRLQVNSNVIGWFPIGDFYRDSHAVIQRSLSGITPVSIVLQNDDGESLLTDVVVKSVDDLTAFISSREEVGAVISFTDLLRSFNRALVEENTLPVGEDALNQAVLFLSGIERFSRLLTTDSLSACVHVRLDDNDSIAIENFSAAVGEWWSRRGVPGVSIVTTGIMAEFARSQDRIARYQIVGLLFAGAVIAMVLFTVLDSAILLFAVLVANLPPLFAVYGAMGWVGIPVDAATASIGAVALGIAVDDSVHLGLAIQQGRDRMGAPVKIVASVGRVFPMLLLTTILVCAGFGALASSGFVMVQNLGSLTCAIVSLCLVCDGTLLPAVIKELAAKEV